VIIYPLLYWLTITRYSTVPVLHITLSEKMSSSKQAELLKTLMDSKPEILFQGKDGQNSEAVPALLSFSNTTYSMIKPAERVTSILNDNMSMDDPHLIETIRKNLIPPSEKRYKFKNLLYYKPNANPSAGQVQAVQDIL
ncbi:unnamed protein product, partial [Allacma fusca]